MDRWTISILTRHQPAIFLFLLVFAFYVFTLAPSVTWADGARLQLDVVLGGSNYWFRDELRHFPTDGLPFDRLGVMPWDHPLYVMLGQAFLFLPFGEPATRINLLSALAGAVAVTLAYQIGVLLAHDRWAATLGALALAVSHTFWFHAVTAEVYTLHALFVAALLLLALRWPHHRRSPELRLFSFLGGLGLANHLMLVLTLLPAATYILLTTIRIPGFRSATGTLPIAPRSVGDCPPPRQRLTALGCLVGLFVVGFAPWWVQFVRMARLVGVSPSLEFASGVGWLPGMLVAQSWQTLGANLGSYVSLLVYQFTPIGILLGLYGILWLRRRQASVAVFLAAHFVGYEVFSANYPVADRFAFHLPSYQIFALFITCGVAGLFSKVHVTTRTHRLGLADGMRVIVLAIILMPVGIYSFMPATVRAAGLTAADLGIRPVGSTAQTRDGLEYFLNPNQHGDDSAARFGRSTLAELAPNALVFAAKPVDHEAYLVLRYFQVAENLRPDVQLDQALFVPESAVSQTVLRKVGVLASCRPLYLASLDSTVYPLATLQTDFEVVPEANLYRLVPRNALTAGPPAVDCSDSAENVIGVGLVQLIRGALQ